MTRLEDRQTLLHAIQEARAGGARLASACALVGIDPRTVQRWQAGDGLSRGDRRPEADRPTPAPALTAAERARIIEIANEPRFAETRRRASSRRWPTKAPTSPARPASSACCAPAAR